MGPITTAIFSIGGATCPWVDKGLDSLGGRLVPALAEIKPTRRACRPKSSTPKGKNAPLCHCLLGIATCTSATITPGLLQELSLAASLSRARNPGNRRRLSARSTGPRSLACRKAYLLFPHVLLYIRSSLLDGKVHIHRIRLPTLPREPAEPISLVDKDRKKGFTAVVKNSTAPFQSEVAQTPVSEQGATTFALPRFNWPHTPAGHPPMDREINAATTEITPKHNG